MSDRRAYEEVQRLVKELEGTMAFHAGGAPGGGEWLITLRGRQARIDLHDRNVNELDDLYHLKPGKKPVRWDDPDAWVRPHRLVDDAFWVLVTRLPWKPLP